MVIICPNRTGPLWRQASHPNRERDAQWRRSAQARGPASESGAWCLVLWYSNPITNRKNAMLKRRF